MKKQIAVLSLLISAMGWAQEDKPQAPKKEKEIKEVTITKTKKAVEQKADRTIFDFSEQPNLNTGTALEGIKKLPGLIVSDLTGMAYQGKALDVYMDGQPLNITSNELSAFLEGMPASVIDRIEVVTSPGAEYPATSGGAILNIITSKSARSYLTATYSGNYSFSNYDKYRSKTNNSILLNSKNRWFGWQLNVGQNYRENMINSEVDNISKIFKDQRNRGYFAKAALTFDFSQNDRLLLNYNLNYGNSDATIQSNGIYSGLSYTREDETKSLGLRHEASATYQKRFSGSDRKLDFKFTYTKRDNDFEQKNLFLNQIPTNRFVLDNSSDARTAEFRVDFSQPLSIFDKGKISVGGLYERLDFTTESRGITNLDYQRQTASSYVELQTTIGKLDFILGTRAEDYDIGGTTYNSTTHQYDDLHKFKQYRFFPNASVQYNITRGVKFSVNYNKKISLPSISLLNPNNSTYGNGNIQTTGNANLQPTIYDNIQARISAFDYVFLGYNLNLVDNNLIQKISRSGDQVSSLNENISSARIHNFNIGFPIPLMIFTKPIKEIMGSMSRTNPDKVSFLYFFANYQLQRLPNINPNGLLYLNATAQIILPKGIKLNANYSFLPAKSGYFYLQIDEPMNNSLDISLSKKFMDNKLSVSLYVNDVFNTNKWAVRSIYQTPNVLMRGKNDTRAFGISVNYKIPTRNKLAKENPNMLSSDKKEDEGGLIK